MTAVSDCCDTGVVGIVGVVGCNVGAESRTVTNRRTSSLRTRPSFPVPGMSSIFTLWAFSIPRTAGVARVAYREPFFGASGFWVVAATSTEGCFVSACAGAGLGCAGAGAGSGGGLSSGYFPSSTSISHRAYSGILSAIIFSKYRCSAILRTLPVGTVSSAWK